MANKQGAVTLDDITLYNVDVDPASGAGTQAFVGDLAIDDLGNMYLKQASADTNWFRVLVGPSNQGFTAGRIAFGAASGGNLTEDSNLFWDNSTKRLGLGVSPTARIHLDQGNATATAIKFTAGTTTGQTATDGFDVGISTAGTAELRQRENIAMHFFTNNTRYMTLLQTGQLAIGNSVDPQDITGGGLIPSLQVIGNTSTTAQIAALIYSADANPAILNMTKSRNTTLGSHTIVNSADEIGRVQFRASNGSAFQQAASIRCYIDGTPGVSSMPGRISFWTTPSASTTSVERMRIDNIGTIIMGDAGAVATDVSSGLGVYPTLQVISAGTFQSQMVLATFSADANPSVVNLMKSRGGLNAQSLVSADDELGRLQFRGSDGTYFQAGASIRAAVDGTAASNSMPGRLLFMTTATGAVTPTERLRIDATGQAIFSANIRIADHTDTTNGNIVYRSSEFLGRVAGTWRNLAIVPTVITSGTGSLTTTSATYSTITGLTTTPAAGTYLVYYSVNVSISNNSNGDVAIFLAGNEQVETTRNVGITNSLGTSTNSACLSAMTVLTVNGSQVVDVRFRENGGGTLSVTNKVFILIPIAR